MHNSGGAGAWGLKVINCLKVPPGPIPWIGLERTSTAIGFQFFNIDLLYLKRLLSLFMKKYL
jgi:hypothetical protein